MSEITPKQQFVSLISNAKKILLLSHENPDADAIGSLLGLLIVLRRLKKEAIAICPDDLPSNLQFLPFASMLKKDLENQDLVINIDCGNVALDKLGYKMEDHTLKIVVKTLQGSLKKENLSVFLTAEDYDVVIVLDAPDLERISYFYQEHPELFYRSVVVNIDHHPTNTYFGKVNLVDLTATSTSEILIGLIEALEKEEKLIDKAVAHCLLAGIIGDTGSFQNSNTTPKSLTCAAQLLAAGADQQQIVQNLFKTKSLSTLRLWGRVLQQIQEDRQLRFVLGRANKTDFQESNAKEEEISGVIDELLRSLPDYDLVILLSEKEKGVAGSLRAINPTVDCLEIAKTFGGGGHRGAAGFLVKEGSIEEVAQQVVAKVREYQAKRLGLNLVPNSTPPVISSEKPTS